MHPNQDKFVLFERAAQKIHHDGSIELDTRGRYGPLDASGIAGLAPVASNPDPRKTRATGTMVASFDVARNQRLSVGATYRQEPFNALSTTMLIATYSVGL